MEIYVRLCNLGEMVLEEMSWHLRYYEFSYMYYIVGSAVLCLTYTIIYCIKMPVNKIKNLKDVIDFDPQINEGLFEIIRAGEQEDKKFEVRCSTPAYFKPGYVAEKRRKSKAATKLAEFCIVAQGRIGLDRERQSSCRLYHCSILYRASHLVGDWVGLARIMNVPLSAQFCLG